MHRHLSLGDPKSGRPLPPNFVHYWAVRALRQPALQHLPVSSPRLISARPSGVWPSNWASLVVRCLSLDVGLAKSSHMHLHPLTCKSLGLRWNPSPPAWHNCSSHRPISSMPRFRKWPFRMRHLTLLWAMCPSLISTSTTEPFPSNTNFRCITTSFTAL